MQTQEFWKFTASFFQRPWEKKAIGSEKQKMIQALPRGSEKDKLTRLRSGPYKSVSKVQADTLLLIILTTLVLVK